MAELRGRMEDDARRYGGWPREAVVAWQGYLAGLVEWDVISVGEHDRPCDLLSLIEDSPATRILTGWDEADADQE